MKKVMVCGCGAQGSAIRRKLDGAPDIEEIVCAGCELFVNVMPLEFGANVMRAALRIKAYYQFLFAC